MGSYPAFLSCFQRETGGVSSRISTIGKPVGSVLVFQQFGKPWSRVNLAPSSFAFQATPDKMVDKSVYKQEF